MSKALENFVVFGTAFPETTDKDRRAGRSDAGQFVPVWKQEARDEQGRRRFHGAFTGGFSAGYFNTVGSKEGWEPSNFVSSRSARNERKEARPEDYMDEEDLEAMAGARKLVATEEFDILGGTERELATRKKLESESGDLLGSSLMGMFGPPKDSVGIRLLRKMGWRPGQGIGPRTKRSLDDEESDDDSIDMTFAPRDTPIENFQAKRDTYGLGYDLSSSVPQVAEMKRLREITRQEEMSGTAIDSKNRASFGVQGSGAFGLGAFDENDGDDDDVYGGSEPALKNYHHALYDENEGGFTKDEIKAQGLKRKRQQEAEQTTNTLKCSDGRPPLKGFLVSDQKQHIGKWHPPPKVPEDFKDHHVPSNDTPKAASITKESAFSFEERGNALGEKPIEARSVFDYIPKHSKDKLDRAVSFFIDIGKDKSQLADFPVVPKDVAKLALQGFMPFGDNLKKQARYRHYLENLAGHLTEDGVPKSVLPIPEGLSYEAGMKEMDEFAKAARIFRPISAMMSGRFTSAAETKNVEVVNFEGGLKTEEQYRKEKEARAKAMPEPEKKQLTQEAEAAAMKMFGNLTRTVKPFYPNRIVCKRFNVRNPHPNHDPTAGTDVGRSRAGNKEALSKESMESMLNERLPLKFTSENQPEPNDVTLKAVIPKPSERITDESAPSTGVNKEVIKDEEEEGAPLDYERPSMDIFKAIFDNLDDSDDSDEMDEEQPKNTLTTVVEKEEALIGPPAPPPVATVDIPIEKKSAESSEPFRPMFKRASERKEPTIPLTNVISEEFVVQPFKPRSSKHKRRHVSISDEEEEDGRSSSRHHKSSRHKHSKSSRRRSTSRDVHSSRGDKDSRERRHKKSSRDEERSHKSSRRRSRSPGKHRSSRKRSRSPDERKRKSKKATSPYRSIKPEEEYEGVWVEKEPVIQTHTSIGKKKESRKSAADMW
ncbi:hypothetical protein INT47_001620 [Mucor saturninus]|uniref:G-patch domain-containing protein n=1 Tax=Mucor saturninus TaxID=64648 RepID=A0A8H7RJG8_9FUNG|nr:hypothetical protein INT47_001620 [Mucor saturninus]